MEKWESLKITHTPHQDSDPAEDAKVLENLCAFLQKDRWERDDLQVTADEVILSMKRKT